MTSTTELQCDCGAVALEVREAPILTAACYCTSCREAGARWAAMPTPAPVLEEDGHTAYVLYRKDRVHCLRGADAITSFRLAADSSTRRVYARCCRTPLFLEFLHGHWVSLYAQRWPAATRPAMEMRTMTGDLPAGTTLSDALPSPRTHSVSFMARLFLAWVRMGFRTPPLPFVAEASA